MDFEAIGTVNGFTTTVPVTTANAPERVDKPAPAPEFEPVEIKSGGDYASRRVEKEDFEKTIQYLDKIISEANKKLLGAPSSMVYSVHRPTKEIMIKIIDDESKETIKEIPPEKALDALAKMRDLMGILFDVKI